jgi:hypothetical protein
LMYVNEINPISLVVKDTVNYGEYVDLIDHVYSSASSTLTTYINTVSSFPVTSDYVEVDGDWADVSTLIGGDILSDSATVYVTDGVDTVSTTVNVKMYTVEVEDLKFTGGPGQPSVTVLDAGVYPESLIIDSYSTVSGDTNVSLMGGSYKFVIQASDGELYTQYRTIAEDTKITLQGTGVESVIRPLSVNSLSMEISDTVMATGDTPTLTFDILDKNTGFSKDLTGYSIYFAMRLEYTSNVIVDKPCTITGTGKATVQLSTSDTALAGSYIAEVSIEKDGDVLTVIPHFIIDIIEGLH